MRKTKSRSEASLLHLVEEATELLRRVDARAWVWWLGGTAPFVCMLLHFWTDMSRAADADVKLPAASLLLAVCYWWMKVSHCVFGDLLLRHLRQEPVPERMPLRARCRFLASQALIHFTTPWLLLLSLAAMLPFGWVYAFYHNVTILSLSQFRNGGRTRDVIQLAMNQSNYKPAQNHGFILVLMVLAAAVWMNWWLGLLQICTLARSFTGEDNFLTRNPWTQLSSTVFAATMAASYLVAGPVVKAIYAIRCFYGMSRKNGEDIAVAFRSAGTGASAAALSIVLMLSAAMPPAALAQPSPAAPVAPAAAEEASRINASGLDKSIREVLDQDAFRWRMPRDLKHDAKSGPPGFFTSVKRWLDDVLKDLGDAFQNGLKDFIKKLLGDQDREVRVDPSHATPWADMAQAVLRILLVVLGIALVVLLIRHWRRQAPAPAQAMAMPQVNLESDQVLATQLPENEWLRLAQEKINAGEFRLAMRAFFLATLAHLGERRLLGIAKSKSNGDYVRELGLRARDRQTLRGRFGDSVRAFDRFWYGWHDVSLEQLNQFKDNHQHIIEDAGPR